MTNVVIPTFFFKKEPRCWQKPNWSNVNIQELLKLNFIVTYNIRSPKKILRKIWFCAIKVTTLLPYLTVCSWIIYGRWPHGCVCEGYAWSGGGRRIIRVDLTADGGKTWTSADSLVQDTARHPRHWGWTLWKVRYLLHPWWRLRIRMDLRFYWQFCGSGSVGSILGLPDPYPDPLDRYGSGSFHHKAKIVRKILIPTVLWHLYDFLSLKNDLKVPSKSNKQKNFFCWHLEDHWRK